MARNLQDTKNIVRFVGAFIVKLSSFFFFLLACFHVMTVLRQSSVQYNYWKVRTIIWPQSSSPFPWLVIHVPVKLILTCSILTVAKLVHTVTQLTSMSSSVILQDELFSEKVIKNIICFKQCVCAHILDTYCKLMLLDGKFLSYYVRKKSHRHEHI